MPDNDPASLTPWSLSWIRDKFTKHRWYGVAGIVTVGIVAAGVAGWASGLVEQGLQEATAGPPLVARVDWGGTKCGKGGWVLPEQDAQAVTADQFAKGPAGAAYSSPYVNVKLQGTSAQAVTLDAVRVVVDAGAPATGVWVTEPGCGGAIDSRLFTVSMSSKEATVRSDASEDPYGNKIRPWKLPVYVTQSDVEVFDFAVTDIKCQCSWHVEIDWSTSDEDGTLRIDNNGRPFLTTNATKLACDYTTPSAPRCWRETN